METEQMYEMAGGRGAGGNVHQGSYKASVRRSEDEMADQSSRGVQAQLGRLLEQVNAARENLAVLHKRIMPVLSDDNRTEPSAPYLTEAPRSEVGSQISDIMGRMADLNEMLHSMNDRVAL